MSLLRYKQLREVNKLSLRDLEQPLNSNRNTISQIENGKIDAKASYLYLYSKYFDVSPDYVLGLTEMRNEQEFNNAVLDTLKKHGLDKAPLHEVKMILEKTIELYNEITKGH